MNCFDWKNLTTEYLDGSLAPSQKREADSHLESCQPCKDLHQHYRLILEALQSQTRFKIPTELQAELETKKKKWNPLLHAGYFSLSRSRLRIFKVPQQNFPIFLGVTLGVVLLVSLPKIRTLYERRIQQRLDASNFKELPLSESSLAKNENPEDFPDDFISETEDEPELTEVSWSESSSVTNHKEPSFVWRFIIRTDSPQELRTKTHSILQKQGALPHSKFIHGFSAPGGIQFDVLLPKQNIEELKNQLSELANPKKQKNSEPISIQPLDQTATAPFTWYRNRSKRGLPPETTRVIIWLSLI